MTPSEVAALYRGYAAKCTLLAQTLDDSAGKLALIDMAQAWLSLADLAAKNEMLPIVYEAPPSHPDADG